jgi:hypothetical protein
MFFIAVQTRTGRIFVTKVNNAKTPTLLAAIGKMVQVIQFFKNILPPPPPAWVSLPYSFLVSDQTIHIDANIIV